MDSEMGIGINDVTMNLLLVIYIYKQMWYIGIFTSLCQHFLSSIY